MLLLLTGGFQVIGAAHSYEITLNVKNEPLESVMLKIRKQTGYSVVFSDSRISAKPLTVNIYKQPLEVALDIIFKDQPLSYLIREKAIIVLPKVEEAVSKKKAEQPISDSSVKAQENLRGSVVDSVGMGLPGVTVVVKGSSKSTSTDHQGKFILYNTPGTVTLRFTLLGFEAREVAAGGKNNIRITLRTTTSKLNEVVVKGYYTTSKELNTGSISTVKAADIAKSPVSDPMLALQGRVAGMYIEQTSGIAGVNFRINIRGRNSFANGNDPLYIVDGVPFTSTSMSVDDGNTNRAAGVLSPFNSLNPADIERIDILKDADATAIYGSRGANGVVLITTKKGQAGKGQLDVNYYIGMARVTNRMKLMNTSQYLEMRREAFKNDKLTPKASDYDVNGTWDTTRYTDFQKEFLGRNALTHDAQLSYSGGTNQTQFTLSSGYHQESMIFPGNFYDRKFSFHNGINHRSLDQRFNLGFTAGYVMNDNLGPINDPGGAILLPPNMPALKDANGNITWENNLASNPYATLTQTARGKTHNLLANLRLSYELLPGLVLQASAGYNLMRTDQENRYPFSAYRITFPGLERKVGFARNQLTSWIIEPQLSYRRKLGRGTLDVLTGVSLQANESEARGFTATGFASDELMNNPATAASTTQSVYAHSLYRYLGIYARAGYDLDGKYILNLTARRDGSTRFGTGRQFGNFGSVGAAWIFSKENFLKGQDVLSFGKLRMSYGVTGNDQIGNYQYLNTFASYMNYQGASGLFGARLSNPDYSWEEVKKLEGGLELGFFRDRLMVKGNYYYNRTDNQLIGYSLPMFTGFGSRLTNLPAVLQNTGVELELESTNLRNKKLEWNTSFNLSIPRNKLVSYPDFEKSSYVRYYAIGQPMSGVYVYESLGVDPNTGKYIVKDRNGDKVIDDANDRTKYQFTGQKYYGGLTNSFRYGNWSLDVLIQFVKQTRYLTSWTGNAGVRSNRPVAVLDRWQQGKDNSHAKYRAFSSIQNDELYLTDGAYGDVSFARLKNVALGYKLPERWCRKARLSMARIYFQAQNLYTVFKRKDILLDPETANGASGTPPQGIYTLGMQIKL